MTDSVEETQVVLDQAPEAATLEEQLAVALVDSDPSRYDSLVFRKVSGVARTAEEVKELLQRHLPGATDMAFRAFCWAAVIALIVTSLAPANDRSALSALVDGLKVGGSFLLGQAVKGILKRWADDRLSQSEILHRKIGSLGISVKDLLGFGVGVHIDLLVAGAPSLIAAAGGNGVLALSNIMLLLGKEEAVSAIMTAATDKYAGLLRERIVSAALSRVLQGDVVDGVRSAYDGLRALVGMREEDDPRHVDDSAIKRAGEEQWWISVSLLLAVFAKEGIHGSVERYNMMPIVISKMGTDRVSKMVAEEVSDAQVFKRDLFRRSAEAAEGGVVTFGYWKKMVLDQFFGRLYTAKELRAMSMTDLRRLVNAKPGIKKADLIKAFLKHQQAKLVVTIDVIARSVTEHYASSSASATVKGVVPKLSDFLLKPEDAVAVRAFLDGERPKDFPENHWRVLKKAFDKRRKDSAVFHINGVLTDAITGADSDPASRKAAESLLKAYSAYMNHMGFSFLYSSGGMAFVRFMYNNPGTRALLVPDLVNWSPRCMEDAKDTKLTNETVLYELAVLATTARTEDGARHFYRTLLRHEWKAGIALKDMTVVPGELNLSGHAHDPIPPEATLSDVMEIAERYERALVRMDKRVASTRPVEEGDAEEWRQYVRHMHNQVSFYSFVFSGVSFVGNADTLETQVEMRRRDALRDIHRYAEALDEDAAAGDDDDLVQLAERRDELRTAWTMARDELRLRLHGHIPFILTGLSPKEELDLLRRENDKLNAELEKEKSLLIEAFTHLGIKKEWGGTDLKAEVNARQAELLAMARTYGWDRYGGEPLQLSSYIGEKRMEEMQIISAAMDENARLAFGPMVAAEYDRLMEEAEKNLRTRIDGAPGFDSKEWALLSWDMKVQRVREYERSKATEETAMADAAEATQDNPEPEAAESNAPYEVEDADDDGGARSSAQKEAVIDEKEQKAREAAREKEETARKAEQRQKDKAAWEGRYNAMQVQYESAVNATRAANEQKNQEHIANWGRWTDKERALGAKRAAVDVENDVRRTKRESDIRRLTSLVETAATADRETTPLITKDLDEAEPSLNGWSTPTHDSLEDLAEALKNPPYLADTATLGEERVRHELYEEKKAEIDGRIQILDGVKKAAADMTYVPNTSADAPSLESWQSEVDAAMERKDVTRVIELLGDRRPAAHDIEEQKEKIRSAKQHDDAAKRQWRLEIKTWRDKALGEVRKIDEAGSRREYDQLYNDVSKELSSMIAMLDDLSKKTLKPDGHGGADQGNWLPDQWGKWGKRPSLKRLVSVWEEEFFKAHSKGIMGMVALLKKGLPRYDSYGNVRDEIIVRYQALLKYARDKLTKLEDSIEKARQSKGLMNATVWEQKRMAANTLEQKVQVLKLPRPSAQIHLPHTDAAVAEELEERRRPIREEYDAFYNATLTKLQEMLHAVESPNKPASDMDWLPWKQKVNQLWREKEVRKVKFASLDPDIVDFLNTGPPPREVSRDYSQFVEEFASVIRREISHLEATRSRWDGDGQGVELIDPEQWRNEVVGCSTLAEGIALLKHRGPRLPTDLRYSAVEQAKHDFLELSTPYYPRDNVEIEQWTEKLKDVAANGTDEEKRRFLLGYRPRTSPYWEDPTFQKMIKEVQASLEDFIDKSLTTGDASGLKVALKKMEAENKTVQQTWQDAMEKARELLADDEALEPPHKSDWEDFTWLREHESTADSLALLRAWERYFLTTGPPDTTRLEQAETHNKRVHETVDDLTSRMRVAVERALDEHAPIEPPATPTDYTAYVDYVRQLQDAGYYKAALNYLQQHEAPIATHTPESEISPPSPPMYEGYPQLRRRTDGKFIWVIVPPGINTDLNELINAKHVPGVTVQGLRLQDVKEHGFYEIRTWVSPVPSSTSEPPTPPEKQTFSYAPEDVPGQQKHRQEEAASHTYNDKSRKKQDGRIENASLRRVKAELQSMGLPTNDVFASIEAAYRLIGKDVKVTTRSTDEALLGHAEILRGHANALRQLCLVKEQYLKQYDSSSVPSDAVTLQDLQSAHHRLSEEMRRKIKEMEPTMILGTEDPAAVFAGMLQRRVTVARETIDILRAELKTRTGTEMPQPPNSSLKGLLRYTEQLRRAKARWDNTQFQELLKRNRTLGAMGASHVSEIQMLLEETTTLPAEDGARTFLVGQLGRSKEPLPVLWQRYTALLETTKTHNTQLRRVAEALSIPTPPPTTTLAEIAAQNTDMETVIFDALPTSSRKRGATAAEAMRGMMITAGRAYEALGGQWVEPGEITDIWKLFNLYMDTVSKVRAASGTEASEVLAGEDIKRLDEMRANALRLVSLLKDRTHIDAYTSKIQSIVTTSPDAEKQLRALNYHITQHVAVELEAERDALRHRHGMQLADGEWEDMGPEKQREVLNTFVRTKAVENKRNMTARVQEFSSETPFFRDHLAAWYDDRIATLPDTDLDAHKLLQSQIENDRGGAALLYATSQMVDASKEAAVSIPVQILEDVHRFGVKGGGPRELASLRERIRPHLVHHYKQQLELLTRPPRGLVDTKALLPEGLVADIQALLDNTDNVFDSLDVIRQKREEAFTLSGRNLLQQTWNKTDDTVERFERDLHVHGAEAAWSKAYLRVTNDINAPIPRHLLEKVTNTDRYRLRSDTALRIELEGSGSFEGDSFRPTHAHSLYRAIEGSYYTGTLDGYPLRRVEGTYTYKDADGNEFTESDGRWDEHDMLTDGTRTEKRAGSRVLITEVFKDGARASWQETQADDQQRVVAVSRNELTAVLTVDKRTGVVHLTRERHDGEGLDNFVYSPGGEVAYEEKDSTGRVVQRFTVREGTVVTEEVRSDGSVLRVTFHKPDNFVTDLRRHFANLAGAEPGDAMLNVIQWVIDNALDQGDSTGRVVEVVQDGVTTHEYVDDDNNHVWIERTGGVPSRTRTVSPEGIETDLEFSTQGLVTRKHLRYPNGDSMEERYDVTLPSGYDRPSLGERTIERTTIQENKKITVRGVLTRDGTIRGRREISDLGQATTTLSDLTGLFDQHDQRVMTSAERQDMITAVKHRFEMDMALRYRLYSDKSYALLRRMDKEDPSFLLDPRWSSGIKSAISIPFAVKNGRVVTPMEESGQYITDVPEEFIQQTIHYALIGTALVGTTATIATGAGLIASISTLGTALGYAKAAGVVAIKTLGWWDFLRSMDEVAEQSATQAIINRITEGEAEHLRQKYRKLLKEKTTEAHAVSRLDYEPPEREQEEQKKEDAVFGNNLILVWNKGRTGRKAGMKNYAVGQRDYALITDGKKLKEFGRVFGTLHSHVIDRARIDDFIDAYGAEEVSHATMGNMIDTVVPAAQTFLDQAWQTLGRDALKNFDPAGTDLTNRTVLHLLNLEASIKDGLSGGDTGPIFEVIYGLHDINKPGKPRHQLQRNERQTLEMVQAFMDSVDPALRDLGIDIDGAPPGARLVPDTPQNVREIMGEAEYDRRLQKAKEMAEKMQQRLENEHVEKTITDIAEAVGGYFVAPRIAIPMGIATDYALDHVQEWLKTASGEESDAFKDYMLAAARIGVKHLGTQQGTRMVSRMLGRWSIGLVLDTAYTTEWLSYKNLNTLSQGVGAASEGQQWWRSAERLLHAPTYKGLVSDDVARRAGMNKHLSMALDALGIHDQLIPAGSDFRRDLTPEQQKRVDDIGHLGKSILYHDGTQKVLSQQEISDLQRNVNFFREVFDRRLSNMLHARSRLEQE